jgi:hypothetical protein
MGFLREEARRMQGKERLNFSMDSRDHVPASFLRQFLGLA